MKTKDFFGDNLRNLGFFDNLNLALHLIAARLFEYGEWIMKEAEPIVDRQQVQEAISRIRIYEDGTPRTKHITSNIDINVDEDAGTAKSECYVTVFQQTEGFSLQPVFSGYYFFDFTRVDGAWRFTKREIRYGLVGDLSAHLKAPSEAVPNT